jgi:hypothetical protein
MLALPKFGLGSFRWVDGFPILTLFPYLYQKDLRSPKPFFDFLPIPSVQGLPKVKKQMKWNPSLC